MRRGRSATAASSPTTTSTASARRPGRSLHVRRRRPAHDRRRHRPHPGFASISPGAGELGALYVDPQAWGTGLGQALIIEAERRLAERHAVAGLWVLAGNVRARRFYEAGGWQHGRHRARRAGLRRPGGRGALPEDARPMIASSRTSHRSRPSGCAVRADLVAAAPVRSAAATAGPARSRPGRGRGAGPARRCAAAAGRA